MRYKKSDITTHKNNYIVPDDYWNEHPNLKSCALELQELKLSLLKNIDVPKDIDRVILSNVIISVLNIFRANKQSSDKALKEGQNIADSLLDKVVIKDTSSSVKAILTKYNLENTNEDFLGFLYQLLQNQHGRKSDGQFYTPKSVVRQIIKQVDIDITKDRLIADPACGSGQFLLEAFNALDFLYASKNPAGNKAERYSKILLSLVGIDIDEIACLIARFNLLKRSEFLTSEKPRIICSNTLRKTTDLFEQNPLQEYEKRIDIIVGNPPWGAKLTSEEKSYFQKNYQIGQVGLNTFTLFIERSLDLLRDSGGRLGFLIPEAYLKIKNHQLSRQQILNKSKIKVLQICGDIFKKVYAPALIIVVETTGNEDQRVSNNVKISKSLSENNGTVLIPQKTFYSTHENIFNINHSDKSEKIKKKLQDQEVKYLKDSALFFLGIVTGDNNKHLTTANGDPKQSRILVGKDVNQYKINFSGHYFVYDKSELQQVAPKNYYLEPEKLLYKFISSKLIFAYDNQAYFMLNNINGMIPRIKELRPRYILGLLNSKLLQYYYSSTFFTVKVLRGNLERLPLKVISQERQSEIERMVLSAEEAKSDWELKKHTSLIDEAVYDLYGVKGEEVDFIENELSNRFL